MKDGLTRSDRAFLKRTAMTGDHPWAVRVWAYIQQNESPSEVERLRKKNNDLLSSSEAEIARLRAERDFVAGERDRHLQAIEELVRDLNDARQEVSGLREAAGDLVQEWTAYIGHEDTEGHDDAVLVGEKIAALRAALSRTGDDAPWGVQP